MWLAGSHHSPAWRRRSSSPNPPPYPTEVTGIPAESCARGPCCPLPSLPQAPLGSEGWLGEPPSRQDAASQEAMLRVLDAGLERCLALHSAVQCIPVPRHR